MDDWVLRQKLRELGMGCFVTYFHEFANSKLSRESVIRILREREGYTEGSCASRTDNARNIIVADRAIDALQLIIGNPNVDYRIKEKAKTLAEELRNEARDAADSADTHDANYQAGYQAGYQSGHEEGYLEGYQTGYQEGYQSGYQAGRAANS